MQINEALIPFYIPFFVVPSEEEQQTALQRMLNYVDKMPSQETFQPPALPFVSFPVDETNVKYHDLAIQKPILH